MPFAVNEYIFADEKDNILSRKKYSSDKLAIAFSLHLASRYDKTIFVYKTICISGVDKASATERRGVQSEVLEGGIE